jgi:caffeoyl-CoA O-methyltransferase
MISANDLEKYLEEFSSPEDPILKQIYRETNIRMLNARMITGHIQGQLLTMFARILKPDLILEIGTFTGYSAICLAKGLNKGGKLHTIEENDEVAEIAGGYFKKAGMDKSIVIHNGNALTVVPKLNMLFDLIYIDGEKIDYPEFYKISIKCLKPGGYLFADNVLWEGKVLKTSALHDKATIAVHKFNQMVKDNKSLEKVILPIRDGLLIARLKS